MRVLQALFNLYAFFFFDADTKTFYISFWGVERLVTATLAVVDILTDDFPVIYIEYLLSQYMISII